MLIPVVLKDGSGISCGVNGRGCIKTCSQLNFARFEGPSNHYPIQNNRLRREHPRVRTEVERIERDESALLDALLKARQDAGLTQAQVAERMGTQAPAVARLERSLSTGKHSPSVATLRKYVKACGKRLVLRVA